MFALGLVAVRLCVDALWGNREIKPGYQFQYGRNCLIRFIEHRTRYRRIIRLIAKWLMAGVFEDSRLIVTAPQGAVISPLLANIYLHYVYDLWAQQWRQRYTTGEVVALWAQRHGGDARRNMDCVQPE